MGVINRNFQFPELTEEQRQRAYQHLCQAGYDSDNMQPLIWPEGAVSASRDHPYQPWQYVYKSDVIRRKKEQQERNLRFKRDYNITSKRFLYVWTFWCPDIYTGWWTYLIGRDISYGRYLDRNKNIVERLMELFNPEPMLFDISFRDWQLWFVKKFQKGKWCGKPQGKSPVLAEVRGSHIERIIKRVEWPKTGI